MKGKTEKAVQDKTVKKPRNSFFVGVSRIYNTVLEELYKILSSKRRFLLFFASWSILINYFLESALRKNMLLGFTQIITQPHIYLYNSMIIFSTFILMLFIKRRLFYFIVLNVFWVGLAITDYVLLLSRNTPLNASDFRIIKSAFSIIPIYLSVCEIIVVSLLIIFAVFLLVIAFVKGKKSNRDLRFSSKAAGIIFIITALLTIINTRYVTSAHFSDLPTAYKEHGFAFSFLCSVFDRGIDKPETYDDEEVIQAFKEQFDDQKTDIHDTNNVNESAPNIIFLQLESFYDPTNFKDLTFSEDPVPIFRALKQNGMSGKLTVPSIGAGTANTEFEVITGMDIDYFGVAEYPYLSILQDNTCESVAYNFKEYGYAVHAMHNHNGTFYDRNKVFPNLGFDTFTSIENMQNITRNPLGWAKDSVLTDEISNLMESTTGQPDMIYAISVQAHGKYPVNYENYEGISNNINVSGMDDNEQRYGFEYWVNQIRDVDAFIGSLINKLSDKKEPTVVIMFGDHLPSFDYETLEIREGNLYQTEYVIWSNFELLENEDRDLNSYELSSYVMSILGFEAGYISKLHIDNFNTDKDYSNELHLLQYDLLYGDKMLYENGEIYIPANTKYGYKQVSISDINVIENNVFVYGEGFNEYSRIYINGNRKNTSFISDSCVSAGNIMLKDGDIVKVVQVSADLVEMGESMPYMYGK